MRLVILALASVFAILLMLPDDLKAADGSSGTGRFDFRQKATSKEGSRWTLQEWLNQKERSQMMDLWLAMYSPSPYEFYVTGSYNSYKTTVDPSAPVGVSNQSYSGGLGAYATVVGLEASYENNTAESYNDLSGSLNVRIAGNAVQGTHVNIFYGLRTRHETLPGVGVLRLNQPFLGTELDLYIMRYFGIHGKYQYFQDYSDGTLGDLKSTRAEGGAFIDFSALRVFGNYYREKEEATKNAVTSETDRTGISTGIKFFF